MFPLVAAMLLEVEPVSFAERVEMETGHFCERRFDDSVACWPGKIKRVDGVFGSISVDLEGECLRISFPDGSVCGLPEGALICEEENGALSCHGVSEAEVDWTEIASRFRE